MSNKNKTNNTENNSTLTVKSVNEYIAFTLISSVPTFTILTFLYLSFYFNELKIDVEIVPLSINDYLSSIRFFWKQFVILIFSLFTFFLLIDLHKTAKHRETFPDKIEHAIIKIGIVMPLLVILSMYDILIQNYIAMIIFAFILILYFIIYKKTSNKNYTPSYIITLIIFIAVFTINIFLISEQHAITSLNSLKTIKFSNSEYSVIRAFDKGYLVCKDKKIKFISNDGKSTIELNIDCSSKERQE